MIQNQQVMHFRATLCRVESGAPLASLPLGVRRRCVVVRWLRSWRGRVVSDDFWEMLGFVALGCLLIVLTVPLVLELLS
jgi:hypothetical protein